MLVMIAFEVLKLCVSGVLLNCNGEDDAESEIISSVGLQISTIKKTVQCIELPSIQCSVNKKTIIVQEGEIPGQAITVTLGGNPADLCDSSQSCSIRIDTQIIEKKSRMPKCSDGTKIRQLVTGGSCDSYFTPEDWDKPQVITLSARLDKKIEEKDYRAKFSITGTLVIDGEDSVTKPICDYKVIVIDNDKPSICNSVNDPHIKTFDGKPYDAMRQGEFLLYRNKKFGYEVRAYYTTCLEGKPTASCNCGVCAKIDDDVFCINRCYGRIKRDLTLPTMWENSDVNTAFKVIEERNGRLYSIYFPTGTKVMVFLEKPSREGNMDFINIQIQPSAADFGQTEGLCGVFDGDDANDFTGPDGVLYLDEQTDDFNMAWGSKPADFIFTGVPEDIEPTIAPEYCYRSFEDNTCSCDSQYIVESCDQSSEGIDVTSTLQRGSTSRRKKRALGDPLDGMVMDINAIPPVAVFPTPVNQITFAEANVTCFDALTGADFIDICSIVINPGDITTTLINCIDDIKYIDDLETDFIRTAIESIRERCTAIGSTSSNSSLINDLKNITCPNSCYGQGTCENGTCVCNTGYRGYDCAIDIATPPDLDFLEDSFCESIIDGTCARVTVIGNNFVNGSICHLETVEMLSGQLNRTGIVQNVTATWRTFEELSCDLSQVGGLPLHTVMVSVSNNGLLTSQSVQHLYIAHNPICFTCTQNGQTDGTCQKERASCYVDGVCYRPLDQSVSDPCYICDVYSEQMIYQTSDTCPIVTSTTDDSIQESDKSRILNDSVVIGVSAGAAGLVLIIVVVVVMILVLRYMRAKKENSDEKDLTRRSDSSQSGEDAFREVLHPAYPNHGYADGYPTVYLEAPQDYFVENIPKRHNHYRSDPTRNSRDGRENRKSRNHRDDAVYESRQNSRT